MTPEEANPTPPRAWPAWTVGAAWLALAGAAVLSGAIATGADSVRAGVFVFATAAVCALIAGLWLAGAAGFGLAFRAAFARDAPALDRAVLCATLGLGVALLLGRALGAFGLVGGVASLAPTAVGALLLTRWLRRGAASWRPALRARVPATVALAALLSAPGAGLTLLASTVPPGLIWESEANGYDTLSYHLQLPKEWIAGGRIEPLEHNVYSFLPSAMEAAFAHVASMTRLAIREDAPLGAGSTLPVVAPQAAHALVGLLGALAIGALARRLALRAGASRRDAGLAGALGAGVAVSVPWAVVVGSMAYNEMAVVAAGAGAALALATTGLGPRARGAVVGFLAATACAAKPTAVFLIVPALGGALLALTPRGARPGATLAGAASGLAALAPWLVHNAIATGGNPVFPAATGLLGAAHWSAEQAARWSAGHALDLGPAARLARLFDPAFGVTHAQWSVAFPAGALALLACLATRRLRAPALWLGAGLALLVVAWLAVGHLQSRFLLPALVPLAALVGLSACADAVRRAGAFFGVGAIALLLGASWSLFAAQQGGRAGALAAIGIAPFNAAGVPPEDIAAIANEGRAPTGLVLNGALLGVDPAARVLLVGDATPLYYGAVRPRLAYATTWDTNPLARALADAGGDAGAALRRLRAESGFTHALINFAEVERLRRSGWWDPALPPDELEAMTLEHLAVVFAWPERGVFLAELPAPAGGAP